MELSVNIPKLYLRGNVKTPENEDSFLEIINSIASQNKAKFNKISVAMPGFVNKKNAIYLYGTNIKYEIDFKKINNFDHSKFVIDNDGNVAAYAEYHLNYKDKLKKSNNADFWYGHWWRNCE